MKQLHLTSRDGFFVSYDLSTIKTVKTGKAKSFYDKKECEENGIKVSDAVIIINFKNGTTSSFSDSWTMTFA